MLSRPSPLTEFKFTPHTPTSGAGAVVTTEGKQHHFVRCLGEGLYGTAYLFTGGIVIKEIDHDSASPGEAKKEASLNQVLLGNSGYLQDPQGNHRIMMPYRGVSLLQMKEEMQALFLTAGDQEKKILTIKFFKQLFQAFLALYKTRILHNDMTAGNIAIDKNGEFCFIDFGRAYFYTDKEEFYQLRIRDYLANLLKDFCNKSYLSRYFDSNILFQIVSIARQIEFKESEITPCLEIMDEWLLSNGCTDSSDYSCFANIATGHLAKHGYNPDGEKDNLPITPEPVLEKKNTPKQPTHAFFKPPKITFNNVIEILIRSVAMLLGPLNPFMWLYLFNMESSNNDSKNNNQPKIRRG